MWEFENAKMIKRILNFNPFEIITHKIYICQVNLETNDVSIGKLIDKNEEQVFHSINHKPKFIPDIKKYNEILDGIKKSDPKYQIDNIKLIPLLLTITNRKSVSIIIPVEGHIIVKAPKSITKTQVDQLLHSKSKWILNKLSLNNIKQEIKKNTANLDNNKLIYLGKVCDIHFGSQSNYVLEYREGVFYTPFKSPDEIRSFVIEWYKQNAKYYLKNRTALIASKYNFRYKTVKINSATSRWGSCSSDNSINYSWKLLQAPPEVIDYVVIHELVHTIIKDHSSKFWDTVGKIYPDYPNAVKWLKDNNHLIHF